MNLNKIIEPGIDVNSLPFQRHLQSLYNDRLVGCDGLPVSIVLIFNVLIVVCGRHLKNNWFY